MKSFWYLDYVSPLIAVIDEMRFYNQYYEIKFVHKIT